MIVERVFDQFMQDTPSAPPSFRSIAVHPSRAHDVSDAVSGPVFGPGTIREPASTSPRRRRILQQVTTPGTKGKSDPTNWAV